MVLGTRCTTHTLRFFVIHLGPAQSGAGNSVRTKDTQPASDSSVLPENYVTFIEFNLPFSKTIAAS